MSQKNLGKSQHFGLLAGLLCPCRVGSPHSRLPRSVHHGEDHVRPEKEDGQDHRPTCPTDYRSPARYPTHQVLCLGELLYGSDCEGPGKGVVDRQEGCVSILGTAYLRVLLTFLSTTQVRAWCNDRYSYYPSCHSSRFVVRESNPRASIKSKT